MRERVCVCVRCPFTHICRVKVGHCNRQCDYNLYIYIYIYIESTFYDANGILTKRVKTTRRHSVNVYLIKCQPNGYVFTGEICLKFQGAKLGLVWYL